MLSGGRKWLLVRAWWCMLMEIELFVAEGKEVRNEEA